MGAEMNHARRKNEKGFAMMETVVFMMGFVILAAYCIDFFSIVHTGILNSTAARTYLFETLQHRTNIAWFRQADEDTVPRFNFSKAHFRFHGTSDEDQPEDSNDGAHASGRRLTQATDESNMNDGSFFSSGVDSQKNQTSTIQIKTGYGICLDAQCQPGG